MSCSRTGISICSRSGRSRTVTLVVANFTGDFAVFDDELRVAAQVMSPAPTAPVTTTAATVSGTGAQTAAGTGAVTSTAASLSGTGDATYAGTGALTSAALINHESLNCSRRGRSCDNRSLWLGRF
mgnify:CR=1 FL=1